MLLEIRFVWGNRKKEKMKVRSLETKLFCEVTCIGEGVEKRKAVNHFLRTDRLDTHFMSSEPHFSIGFFGK